MHPRLLCIFEPSQTKRVGKASAVAHETAAIHELALGARPAVRDPAYGLISSLFRGHSLVGANALWDGLAASTDQTIWFSSWLLRGAAVEIPTQF